MFTGMFIGAMSLLNPNRGQAFFQIPAAFLELGEEFVEPKDELLKFVGSVQNFFTDELDIKLDQMGGDYSHRYAIYAAYK